MFKEEQSKISIGFSETALYDLIPIIQLYQSVYTEEEISIHRMSTSEQLIALEEGKIHIGLICTPIANNNLNIMPIRKQEFEIVLPNSHALSETNEPINIQELKKETFIIAPREVSPAYHDAASSVFHKMSFIPKSTMTAYSSTAIMALVSSGIGIALVPSSMKYFFTGEVIFRKIKHSPVIETSLAWRRNDKSHAVSSIISLVEQFIQKNQLQL